jgi:hypothetical protein
MTSHDVTMISDNFGVRTHPSTGTKIAHSHTESFPLHRTQDANQADARSRKDGGNCATSMKRPEQGKPDAG